MIHPSYVELMDVINEGVQSGEQPVVNCRFSVVAATAKRARQIIDGAELLDEDGDEKKPLSSAVKELYEGKLRILTPDEIAEKEKELVERKIARLELESAKEEAALAETINKLAAESDKESGVSDLTDESEDGEDA